MAESTPVDKRRCAVHCSGMTTRTTNIEEVLRAHGLASKTSKTDERVAAALNELLAVRSEEARLLTEAAAKDERIKELETMLRRVAMCRKSAESSNWGGEHVLDDIEALLAKVSP